jgi:16S rRNA A1518/A1519 N6-dimethyltransferase RsmA/KsgA/DIM1 with predicted DNA glycosylase/AP lyase activity
VEIEAIIHHPPLPSKTEKELATNRLFIVGNLPYYITSPILRKFFTSPAPSQPQHTETKQRTSPYLIEGGLFMVQAEVGEKIKRDADKKSYLYRLLNFAYHVEYLKTVPAKAFNPPPKVKSCLISLVKKSELPNISFEKLVSFLDTFCPYSRKTLGKIAKMTQKHCTSSAFIIPEHIAKKRLEELSRKELEIILKEGS